MDKEKNIKKIITIVVLILAVLVAFIVVRSCDKAKLEEAPIESPTPTPSPTPSEEPEEEEPVEPVPSSKPSYNPPAVVTPVENEVPIEKEPEPVVPVEPVEPEEPTITLEDLSDQVTEALQFIEGLVLGSDEKLGERVNYLNETLQEVQEKLDEGMLTDEEIASYYDEIRNEMEAYQIRYEELLEEVTTLLDETEAIEEPSLRSIMACIEALKQLPLNEDTALLQERVDTLIEDYQTAYDELIQKLEGLVTALEAKESITVKEYQECLDLLRLLPYQEQIEELTLRIEALSTKVEEIPEVPIEPVEPEDPTTPEEGEGETVPGENEVEGDTEGETDPEVVPDETETVPGEEEENKGSVEATPEQDATEGKNETTEDEEEGEGTTNSEALPAESKQEVTSQGEAEVTE